jgi:prepilin-type processing-associated H-X9-DG protein
MLLPAFQKVKNTAKSIVCINNLKQFGVASGMYLADYDRFCPVVYNMTLPGWGSVQAQWPGMLGYYMNIKFASAYAAFSDRVNPKIFVCPCESQTVLSASYWTGEPGYCRTNYILNDICSKFPSQAVKMPGRGLFICDSQSFAYDSSIGIWNADTSLQYLAFRHSGKLNILYLDGHSEAEKTVEQKQVSLQF